MKSAAIAGEALLAARTLKLEVAWLRMGIEGPWIEQSRVLLMERSDRRNERYAD